MMVPRSTELTNQRINSSSSALLHSPSSPRSASSWTWIWCLSRKLISFYVLPSPLWSYLHPRTHISAKRWMAQVQTIGLCENFWGEGGLPKHCRSQVFRQAVQKMKSERIQTWLYPCRRREFWYVHQLWRIWFLVGNFQKHRKQGISGLGFELPNLVPRKANPVSTNDQESGTFPENTRCA